MTSIYPLEALRRIREIREEEARKTVAAAEAVLKSAVDRRIRAEKKAAEYRLWRAEETDRRYASIMGQEINSSGLDDFKAGLAALADRDLALKQDVHSAVEIERSAKEALDAAQQALLESVKSRRKIETHYELWQAEAQKKTERLEDLEFEDFRTQGADE